MSAQISQRDFALEPNDSERLANLSGPFDEHLRQIELRLGVEIANSVSERRSATTWISSKHRAFLPDLMVVISTSGRSQASTNRLLDEVVRRMRPPGAKFTWSVVVT